MDIKNRIKNSFRISFYQTPTPPSQYLERLQKTCVERLTLYKLLQEACTHEDLELYSTGWVLHLARAISKKNLLQFLALLDRDKILELQAKSVEKGFLKTNISQADKLVAEPMQLEPLTEPMTKNPLGESIAVVTQPMDVDPVIQPMDADPVDKLSSVNTVTEPIVDGIENLNISDDHLADFFTDDEAAHLIYTLTASGNEELMKLFVKLEIHWFQLKFHINVPESSIIEFLRSNDMHMRKLSKEEILSIKDLLSFYELDLETNIPPVILKVPFKWAPDLVFGRKVVLKGGYMYFPCKREYVAILLQNHLREQWKKQVKRAAPYLKSALKDERIMLLVDYLRPRMKQVAFYHGKFGPGIRSIHTIDDHASYLFPLCISRLHQCLKENNHLKHFSRMQYSLFLKHAGYPLEEALNLIKSEFTKKMSEEEFIKMRYQYYISHFYGKVGGRINYPVSTCDRIININPLATEENGCPFAHADERNLTNMLDKRDVKPALKEEILICKRNKQYRRACSLYYTEKIGANLESVISPNQYYACALQDCDMEDMFIEPD